MRRQATAMPTISSSKGLMADPQEPKVILIHRMWLLYGFEWFWIILGACFGVLNGCTPIMFYFILGGLLDILVPQPGAARKFQILLKNLSAITPAQLGDAISRQVIYLVLVAIASGLSNGMSQFCNRFNKILFNFQVLLLKELEQKLNKFITRNC
jgi:ABC-type multidrug transport system fused ATPase/permease subunit